MTYNIRRNSYYLITTTILLTTSQAFAGNTGTVTYAPFTGENIPTLSGWMLIFLSLLLLLVAFRSSKNKHSGTNKLFVSLLGVSLLSLGSGTVQLTNTLTAAPPPALSEPGGGDADVFGNQLNTYANTSGITQRITGVDVASLKSNNQCTNYIGDGSVAGECVAGLIVGTGASCTVDCTSPPPTTGTIIIEKQTDPDGDSRSFDFTGNILMSNAFSLIDGQTQEFIDVPTGSYIITEAAIPSFSGWSLSNIACNDNNSTGNLSTRIATINLEADEVVTCTFTNTHRVELYATKLRSSDGLLSSIDFASDERLLNWEFTLYDSNGIQLAQGSTGNTALLGPGTVLLGTLPAGTYTVCETSQSGWNIVGTANAVDPEGLSRPCLSTTLNTLGGNRSLNFWNYELPIIN